MCFRFMLISMMVCLLRFELSDQSPSTLNLLNGQHLRIIWPLWEGNPKGLSGPLKGGVFIDFLSARFNFTYEMVRVTENNHDATANQKGLLSLLFENKADLLVDVVAPRSERFHIIDLSQPWSFEVVTALIPASEVGANINAVIKPFQWQVWLSLGISIAIVIFVANHVNRPLESYFSSQTWRANLSSSSGCRKKNPSGQYLYVFGNLLSQGGPCKFTRLSFRLVAGCWTLAAFVLVQAYTSTLLTYVVLPVRSPLINSVYDIPEAADIKLIVRKNGGVDLILANLNQSTSLYKKLFERIQMFPDSRCQLRSDCINVIQPGYRTVFLEAKPYLLDAIRERYIKNGTCNLQVTKGGFHNFMVSFALQKNSPYTLPISRGILELYQIGLIDHWDFWFRPMPPKCNGEDTIKLSNYEKNLLRLSLKNLTGAFVVLVVGFTVSSLVFLSELLINYLVSKRFRQK